MGPSSAAVKRVRIEDGECLRVTAYVIPGGTTVTIYAVDGGECASDLRTPLVRCGAPVVIDATNRATTLCGPGWFEFQSSGVAGSVLLQVERYDGADQPCGATSVAPTPCSIGAVVPTGTIIGFILGLDINGCLVKQATQTVELRDCNNVLLYTFRAIL